jgi:hypothetical protein
MPPSSETLLDQFAHASMDTMSSTMPINPEPANPALRNALPAQLPQLHAQPVIPQRTELLVLMVQVIKLASASPDSTQLPTVHASNPTAMLILSALNASKDSSSAFNVLPQRTESSSFLRASAFAWTDSMLTQRTTVLPAQVDAESAHQHPTAQAVSLLPLLQEMDNAPAHLKLTSLFLLTEFVIALLVDLTVPLVLMPTLAQLALPPSLKLLTTNVFAQPRTSSTLLANVCPALLDVNPAHLQIPAVSALILLFFKELSVKPNAMTDSPLWDQFVKAAQLDACNAPKTSSASIALMDSTCTTEPATTSAPLEPLVTAQVPTGIAFLATLLA